METIKSPANETVVNPMKTFDLKPKVNEELATIAKNNIKNLIQFESNDLNKQMNIENDVAHLGLDLQREASQKSSLLSTTINSLSDRTETGDLAKALIDLRNQVEIVNPKKFDLEPGFLTRLVGKIFPEILARPMKNYMTKFRTAESVIGEIVNGIAEEQRRTERDNVTLQDRILELRKTDLRLQQAIQVGQLMDDELVSIIDTETDEERKKFLKQKVLLKLRTRVVDLQTVRTVSQQGILSMDLTVDTNRQLIQNAERTRTVTVSALKIAVELRKALSNQKQMLETLNMVNETTNDLILGNSQILKDNAAQISKGAMEATLDLDKLRTAFNNIYTALSETERFQNEALPRLKETIQQFNTLNIEADKKIIDMEKSKKLESSVNLKLE